MAEFAWSDTPCANGHIGWRRITTGFSNGKPYRHSKCEQCRKDNRKKHRSKDKSAALRNLINQNIRIRLQDKPRRKQQNKADILLGCPVEQYILYIQNAWDAMMTWENWGTYWQIDHIKPCHTFDLTSKDEVLRCFHHTNTRPLVVPQNTWKGKAHDNSNRT